MKYHILYCFTAMLAIHSGVDLLPYNSFHFSCIAQYFVTVRSIDELQQLIHSPLYHSTQKLLLGGGSNMLFASKTFDGLIIKNELQGRNIIEETQDHITISCASGEVWDEVVWWTVENNRGGLENLVSIPGTVGAAPVQNIGAYGSEAKDTIIAVQGIDMQSGEERTLSKEQCLFSYRDSVFKSTLKEDFFITEVIIRLEKYNNSYKYNVNYEGVEETAKRLQQDHSEKSFLWCIASAIAQIRASKLPDRKKIGTAGSFFQNPIVTAEQFQTLQIQYPSIKGRPVNQAVNTTNKEIKLSAGQLIELVGLKGYTQNNVGVYERHALVLVNHGNMQGSDLLEIIRHIQQTVQTQFGVTLHPEVNIIYDSNYGHNNQKCST